MEVNRFLWGNSLKVEWRKMKIAFWSLKMLTAYEFNAFPAVDVGSSPAYPAFMPR